MRAPRAGLAAVLLAALLSAPTASSAQAPSAPWRTIETAHFRVHYPAPFEAWARRTAGALESIHTQVTAYVGYTPPRPIEVVVADPIADPNGMAFPFLDRPYMVLWAHPPDVESSIGDSTDWMDLLSVHELAHIVHLTRPRNRPGILQKLLPLPLGPIPILAPRWVIEGYATVVEGALTGSGRPNSSYRAAVLRRFAIEGKLPSYAGLSATGGWLGGSMAYLAGSTFLEWLERTAGEGSLVRLWKRMTSRRGGDFDACFRAVFSRSPVDLYDRFRAELTAKAISEEKRREAAGIVEGEAWQRLRGATFAPQVSPDGSKLLAFRSPHRGQGALAVWTLAETPEEARARARREEAERKIAEDADEIADRPELPLPRAPRWTLSRWNGQTPQDPRWMPDARRVLFTRRVPDVEGVLRQDLFLWNVEDGGIARVTRLADVSDADPSPDGASAVGVRNRFGQARLVRVDLATGRTRVLDDGADSSDPWRTWSHPRVSPDGRSIAALLHEKGSWDLVALSSEGGAPRVLARSAVGPPAWSADGARLFFGTDASGVWEMASIEIGGPAEPEQLTRVTGGAFSPAPTPDGSAAFFLEMTAKGIDIRRLPLPAKPLTSIAREASDFPILPPPSLAPKTFSVADVSAPRPYDALAAPAIRVASGFTAGPSGNSYQSGVEGRDVIGRLGWQALGAFGNAAGPRGGSLAVAWEGLPARLTLQMFSSLEKPGSQRLVPRPELDAQRWGLFANGSWERPFDGARVGAEAGGGWTRVEPETGAAFSRAVASGRVWGRLVRTRGRSGFALSAHLEGALGDTDGGFWRQFSAGGRLAGITSFATLGMSARYGDTGGTPSAFDLFRLGGADSSILPPGLDRNRIYSPAMPAALQLGARLETYGADLAFSALPLVLYVERLRAWDPAAPRPDAVRVAGAELRLERLLPEELRPDAFSFYVGVARVRSEGPHLATTQGYGGLVYRP
ncbi:MAG TPA: hypothetical protein VIA45_11165 [Thermoanaerobaculia bacterium]